MKQNLYGMMSRNKWRTFGFMVVFNILLAAILVAVVYGFKLDYGVTVLIGVGVILYNIILYFNSDKIALLTSGAHPADPDEFRQLHNVVEEVSIAAGVPKPKVHIINEPAPNAFATGRNPEHASIAVTTGLLEIMNREELQGVVAHEMAHIRNYDILLMTIAGIIGGMIIILRDVFLRWMWFAPRRRDSRDRGGNGLQLILIVVGLVLAILAPLLVSLIRAAISREREFLADASGAYITRYPNGLANALEKLGGYQGKLRHASSATAHLFIANPFGQDRVSVAGLFSTHPPLELRVQRLRELDRSGEAAQPGSVP